MVSRVNPLAVPAAKIVFLSMLSLCILEASGTAARADAATPNTNGWPDNTPDAGPNAPLPQPVGGLTIQPVLTQQGVWDSNPLLATSNVQSLYGSITSPEVIISDVTPTKQLRLDETVTQNLFNLSGYDSTDVHSINNFAAKSLNWGAGLTGKIDYDTTRTSEASIYGLNTQTPVRHLGLMAAPQLTYNPLPGDKIGLSATAQTSQYETSAFTNYEVFSVTPSYSHNFDPLNTGLLGVTTQRYQTTEGPRDIVDTITPTVGWQSNLTPSLSVNANIGAQLTKQQEANTATQPWSLDYVYSGDLTYAGEVDKTDLTLSRVATPFGNGTEALLTNCGLKDIHALNSTLSLNVAANYESADYQITSTGNLKTLASVSGGLTYHVTPTVDITGSYMYRIETLVNVSKNPDDHSANIHLVYHPDPGDFKIKD